MTMLLRIADRVLNRPLLIHPVKVPFVLGVLEGRLPIGDVSDLRRAAEEDLAALPEGARQVIRGPAPEANRFVGSPIEVDETGKRNTLPYNRAGGVAIIDVVGITANRWDFLDAKSGVTSYEMLRYQLGVAMADPRAHVILLDIESPGGEAIGTFEVAEAVRRAAAVKPVVAVVDGMAASAGYAIASGASRIVTGRTGVVGSIGTVLLHVDYSRKLDQQGVTPTFIFEGAKKVDGNPFEPLSDEVRADLQREVRQFYDLFVETVAAGRPGLTADAIRATEAAVYIGQEAVDAGLADSVGTFEEVLAELSDGGSVRRVSQPAQAEGITMTNQDTVTRAEHDAAVEAAREEGRKEAGAANEQALATARAEGATAERERILGIEAQALPGHEKLVAGLKADGATTPEQAAVAILKAEREKGAQALDTMRGVEDHTGKVAAAPTATGAVDPAASADRPASEMSDEELTAQYESSPALKRDFACAADYRAFAKAEAAGKVRVLKGKDAA